MKKVSIEIQNLRSQEDLVRFLKDVRFQSLSAFYALLKRIEDVIFESPSNGLAMAEVAPSLARLHSSTEMNRAYAVLGNAYRANEQLEKSRSIFKKILGNRGGRDGFVLNRLSILHAHDQRFEEALEAAAGALDFFRDKDDEEFCAALVASAIANSELENFEDAKDSCLVALRKLKPHISIRIHCTAIHELGIAILWGPLYAEGLREVFSTVKATRIILRKKKIGRKAIPHIKSRWVEALAHLKAFAVRRAERMLLQARADLMEIGAMVEAARVSIHLAQIYLEERRWDDLACISADILHRDRSDFSLEMLSSISLWRQAILEHWLDDNIQGVMYRSLYGRKPPTVSIKPVCTSPDREPIGF